MPLIVITQDYKGIKVPLKVGGWLDTEIQCWPEKADGELTLVKVYGGGGGGGKIGGKVQNCKDWAHRGVPVKCFKILLLCCWVEHQVQLLMSTWLNTVIMASSSRNTAEISSLKSCQRPIWPVFRQNMTRPIRALWGERCRSSDTPFSTSWNLVLVVDCG